MAKNVKNLLAKYTPFERRVYGIVMKIPKGRVMTYGQVAKQLGNPGFARAVGMALSRNQDAPIIPCHRVVGYNNLGGYSASGGTRTKLKILKQEGYKPV